MSTNITYEITVWNMINGDIEAKYWEATESEMDDILEQYFDDQLFEVQVEERL